MCVLSARHPLLLFALTFSAIVLLLSFYLGSSDFLQPRNKDSGSIFKLLLISPANWLRCKPSQQGKDFEVKLLCAGRLGASVCVSNTIRPARCSAANENASNQGVLQGSHPCWCFIVSLSLTLQAGLGMQSGQFLIRGGIGAACERH